MQNINLQSLWLPFFMLLIFLSAIFFRPLLPVDETRYMSVAWEMYLRHDWLAPLTLNFQPYHHKPPMLFWLINGSWWLFGVSRWAAAVPIALVSTTCVYLTVALAKTLFTSERQSFESLAFIMIGSLPFLIDSTLVMFDMTMMMFILAALLALVNYAGKGKAKYILFMGLALGAALLTKGPVAWLYVFFPILFAPFWMNRKINWLSWYRHCLVAFAVSLIPLMLWLVPVLDASDADFAFYLVWEQTAGRITGRMASSHDRPIYFYLPLLPLLCLPWAFFPSFWSGLRCLKANINNSIGLRFIACWLIPTIIVFSLISGKQPHYLVSLLPGIFILIAYMMKMGISKIVKISTCTVALFIAGQGIASQSLFKKYDLRPVVTYMHEHKNKDWLFVPHYLGELTFLGRLESSLDVVGHNGIDQWFKSHPQGMAVIIYSNDKEIADFELLTSMPYRGKDIGVFRRRNDMR